MNHNDKNKNSARVKKRNPAGFCLTLVIVCAIFGLYILIAKKDFDNNRGEGYRFDYIVREGHHGLSVVTTGDDGDDELNEVQKVKKYVIHEIKNTTLCRQLSQYLIPGNSNMNKIVSICLHQNRSRIDRRQFIGDKPTIRGIWFDTYEWKFLTRLIYDITWDVFEQSKDE